MIVFGFSVLPDGQTERWSTHAVTVDGLTYDARVLQHNVFEIQTASEQGVDGIPRISMLLANADSHFSEIERSRGWEGARLTAIPDRIGGRLSEEHNAGEQRRQEVQLFHRCALNSLLPQASVPRPGRG